ncbi:MAG: SRPBCC family protein [Actinobacteria bacterium]|nr:SRPBCC family protein [Actinomycetota bacterium]
MGQKVSDSTRIAADPDTILAVITDHAAYPEWAEGMQHAEVLDTDAEGRPTRTRFQVDAKVVEATYTLAYAYADDRVTWHLVEGDMVNQLDGAYILAPSGSETDVTYELEVDVDIPLPGFMKKRAAKQILDTGLRGLKQRAESRT